jgi:hypothetical protein
MAIVHISKLARNYVRTRATEIMSYECRVERITPPTYNETSLITTAGGRQVLYEGVFRLWEITGATGISVGGEDLMVESTQASFPYESPLFRKDDEIVITAVPEQDLMLMGNRYQIQTKAKAGELRPTRRYTVSSVQRNR